MGGSLLAVLAALALAAGIAGLAPAPARAEGEIALEKVDNPAGLPDSPAEDASFRVALSYQLGTGK